MLEEQGGPCKSSSWFNGKGNKLEHLVVET